ncbi:MAG: Hypoxanthine phosphoribosyltransferase [Candidatus Anoxychlamydiales bacterium]|nr:Hypoxanthine phosphoribosyltransferase [Candidatus Anoxychlamydiales bacterium]NGX51776.1 Hypoxanthine phosphoribosyltransferase [Candidatus Anoxychlamydiales bacterium]
MVSFFIKTEGKVNMDMDFSNLELMISKEEIKSKIVQLAETVDDEYKNKEIVFLMIMKGAFIFTSDLVREIKTPFSIEAIECSSYGLRGKERGELTIQGLEKLDLNSKHVIIVDDIYDSGKTLSSVMKEVEKQNPASLKSLILLVKNTERRLENIALPDFSLFEIEDKFVVGYGLDYKGYFRGLKGIYSVE